jgi:hypothetical protein
MVLDFPYENITPGRLTFDNDVRKFNEHYQQQFLEWEQVIRGELKKDLDMFHPYYNYKDLDEKSAKEKFDEDEIYWCIQLITEDVQFMFHNIWVYLFIEKSDNLRTNIQNALVFQKFRATKHFCDSLSGHFEDFDEAEDFFRTHVNISIKSFFDYIDSQDRENKDIQHVKKIVNTYLDKEKQKLKEFINSIIERS